LPGLIAASVWMRLWRIGRPGCSMLRPRALTTPTVTVGPPSIQNGLPMAMTVSPMARREESPRGTVARRPASIFSTARSVNRSAPTSVARNRRPSARVTLVSSTPSTTWLFVRMYPRRSTTKPEPSPRVGTGLLNSFRSIWRVLTLTMAGRTRATMRGTSERSASWVRASAVMASPSSIAMSAPAP
jgi:hypothetical protein